MATSNPAFHDRAANDAHADSETCPYCEQPITNDRAEEIRARFDANTRRQTAELKTRMDEQLAEARAQLETAKKAEIERIQQEHVGAIEKQKADFAAREQTAREAGKKAAESEATEKIRTMIAEQEAANAKVIEAERKKNEAVTALAAIKAEQESIVATRTGEVRAAMEKKNNENTAALTAKHTQEMVKISEQMATMQRRIDAEEGEGADVKLLDVLKKKFPKDQISAINKGAGANIVHDVKHNGKVCGKIVYDARNRNSWQASFATKLREDMVAGKADHAILTTSKFPAGARHVHCVDGIIAANPARVLALSEILRAEIVRSHGLRLSEQDRSKKTARLYDFIVSEGFGKLLETVVGNDEKLLQLDVDEKSAHDKMWERRGRLIKSSEKLHAKLRDEIDCIIGTLEVE